VASLEFETKVLEGGDYTIIAGLDEAGRGALAGPVVAAAVVLPVSSLDILRRLSDVNDSKKLSPRKRSDLAPIIMEVAVTYGVGSRPAEYIDQHGIIASTKQAMLDALAQTDPQAEYLLIDGRIRLPRSLLPQQSIIRGDSKSLSIAAASILAKVERDQMMTDLDSHYPAYNFAQHKGYATQEHRDTLARLGPTPEHRQSFAPLRASLL
jgi:ribonuclease HII